MPASSSPGKIDRSPTGTGCSALMAVLHAKGMLKAGEAYIGRSIIESRFDCRDRSGNGDRGPDGDHAVDFRPGLDHRQRTS